MSPMLSSYLRSNLDRQHLFAAVRSFVEFLQTRFPIPASWDPGKRVARIDFAP